MKVLGIVCEYNLFHNGHLHHLNMAKKLTNADYVICVMSGNFVQRGNPSILDKWTRTKMALLNGIDMVIELPIPYCISSAYYFAYASISILNSLNIVTDFCFGSEVGDIKPLQDLANILINEPLEYKNHLKTYLNLGYSYAKSRELALSKYLNDDSIKDIMACPNNILGIEYLKALVETKSTILASTITRTNDYNSNQINSDIVSSSAIRNVLNNNNLDLNSISNLMPKSCVQLLKDAINYGTVPIFLEDFDSILFSKLRCMSINELSNINFVSEGLENRLKKCIDTTCTTNDLISSLHTKRFTDTRIKRILLNALLGITKQKFDKFLNPSYIRVLGVSNKGKKLLGTISKSSNLPVLLSSSDALNLTSYAKELFDLECLATNLYVLAYQNKDFKHSNQDLTNKLIVM